MAGGLAIDLPPDRPAGLALRGFRTGTHLWRLDATAPAAWTWDGFPTPKHRFDPASGSFRTRYAANTVNGTARERYLDTGRYIEAEHAGHFLVELVCTRPFRYLDLRNEDVLDHLGLDDRINTSHEEDSWVACHALPDLVRGWWDRVDGIVYRSRTTPRTSANIAFWSGEGLHISARQLPTVRTSSMT